jgi:hypothetical protein
MKLTFGFHKTVDSFGQLDNYHLFKAVPALEGYDLAINR